MNFVYNSFTFKQKFKCEDSSIAPQISCPSSHFFKCDLNFCCHHIKICPALSLVFLPKRKKRFGNKYNYHRVGSCNSHHWLFNSSYRRTFHICVMNPHGDAVSQFIDNNYSLKDSVSQDINARRSSHTVDRFSCHYNTEWSIFNCIFFPTR